MRTGFRKSRYSGDKNNIINRHSIRTEALNYYLNYDTTVYGTMGFAGDKTN
jgi:hypothetical protein